MSFRILYQDDYFIAIDKPAGFHVHPPEDPSHRISAKVNCLSILRDQIGKYIYPVHRLDRATSGVLIFGLTPEAANKLSVAFQLHKVHKTYFCVTRGWITESGFISRPLKSDQNPSVLQEATSSFLRIAKCEVDIKVGPYAKGRYSLIQVEPHSGRRHQIRRHLSGYSHPLVGDTIYGRSEHNRLFKDKLNISGLLLKAYALEFEHPFDFPKKSVRIVSRWNGTWHRVFDLFGMCPWTG